MPKYVFGPLSQIDFKLSLFSFLISIALTAPVIASKPVAKTKSSNKYSVLFVINPLFVILSIGFFETSINDTFSLLYVSK